MKEHIAYIFIAGGIGITPFRSIIADLLDKKEKQNIALFYFVQDEADILFEDVFLKAQNEINLQYVRLITHQDSYFSPELLEKHIPEWQSRFIYISGPQEMVENARDLLLAQGISEEQIKTDLFTGYSFY